MDRPSSEICAPENWETADLEEQVKALNINATRKKGESSVDFENANVLLNESSNEDTLNHQSRVEGASLGLPGIDKFLQEALQNPKDRLTILRMEVEVERFLRNPHLSSMEFAPIPSSYYRLAAHRVAQHHGLVTRLADVLPPGDPADGAVVLAEKPWATHGTPRGVPPRRLADLPIGPRSSSPLPGAPGGGDSSLSSAASLATAERVSVIMKRREPGQRGPGARGGHGLSSNHSSSSGSGGSSGGNKSVEERKEEYERARARIFSSDSLTALEEGASAGSAVQADLGEVRAAGRAREESEERERVEREKERERGERERAGRALGEGVRVQGGRGGQKVAILRDPEKERRDPDFDRSFGRYTPRFDPQMGLPYQMLPPPVHPMSPHHPALNPISHLNLSLNPHASMYPGQGQGQGQGHGHGYPPQHFPHFPPPHYAPNYSYSPSAALGAASASASPSAPSAYAPAVTYQLEFPALGGAARGVANQGPPPGSTYASQQQQQQQQRPRGEQSQWYGQQGGLGRREEEEEEGRGGRGGGGGGGRGEYPSNYQYEYQQTGQNPAMRPRH